MPSTSTPSRCEVEAEVLDHVVGRGVADDRGARVQGGGHQGVLGDGVAALGEHDRPGRLDRPVDASRGSSPSVALTSRPNGRSADMCGSTVRVPRLQPPAYGRSKVVVAVQQRAEEHDDRAGTAGRRPRRCRPGRARPAGTISRSLSSLSQRVCDAEAVQHLEEPVDLLDAGDLAQRGAALVEQGGAQQRDAGVLGRLDVDASRTASSGPVTRRCVGPAPRATISESSAAPMRASISRVRFWWPFSMRLTALWLVLSSSASWCWVQPAVLAGVADQVADAALVVLLMPSNGISDMR